MSISEEFADSVRSARKHGLPSLSQIKYPISLYDFYDRKFDNIYRWIKHANGLKVRISITTHLERDVDFTRIVRRLYVMSDLLVFSPAPPLQCALVADSRLQNLTTSFITTVPSMTNRGHYIRFDSSAALISFLSEAEVLVSGGQILYLPGYSDRDSRNNWSYAGEDFGSTYSEDAFQHQLKTIAQELLVSQRLGCTHVFPHTLDSPLAISLVNATSPLGVVLAQLRIPVIRGGKLEVLAKIKEEEYASFKAFQKAVCDATDKLSQVDPDIRNLRECVDKIQKEMIDESLNKVSEKIRRLQRYSYFRSAGFLVATAGMLFAVLCPFPGKEISGVIGATGLLGLYNEFISVLEKRNGAIKDSEKAYLCRLARL